MSDQPKVCAVCGIVLDFMDGRWMHARELVGLSDHIAVPVDYGQVIVRVMCDFCYAEVPQADIWTVPATDFMMPYINHMSVAHWAACRDCAMLVGTNWPGLVQRATKAYIKQHGGSYRTVSTILSACYEKLAEHMTGPPRLARPGDEGEV